MLLCQSKQHDATKVLSALKGVLLSVHTETLEFRILYLGWKEVTLTLHFWLWSPVFPSSGIHSVFCPPPPALHSHTAENTHMNKRTNWITRTVVILFLSGNQTYNIQIKKQPAAKPSGKGNWKYVLPSIIFHILYLDGWHLCDLFDILERARDVPQRCLVGQLHGSCIQRQKIELLKPGTWQISLNSIGGFSGTLSYFEIVTIKKCCFHDKVVPGQEGKGHQVLTRTEVQECACVYPRVITVPFIIILLLCE